LSFPGALGLVPRQVPEEDSATTISVVPKFDNPFGLTACAIQVYFDQMDDFQVL
jgi:hypothetical protein